MSKDNYINPLRISLAYSLLSCYFHVRMLVLPITSAVISPKARNMKVERPLPFTAGYKPGSPTGKRRRSRSCLSSFLLIYHNMERNFTKAFFYTQKRHRGLSFSKFVSRDIFFLIIKEAKWYTKGCSL
jgi:hypothetical protein